MASTEKDKVQLTTACNTQRSKRKTVLHHPIKNRVRTHLSDIGLAIEIPQKGKQILFYI